MTRTELFDVDREAETLARFDALTGADHLDAPRFENTATRTGLQLRAAMEALDWAGVASLIAPEFRSSDRQSFAHLESGRDEWLTAARTLFAQLSHSHLRGELLATRGDRLALIRAHWTTGGGAVGPSEIVWLQLIETDADGRVVAEVSFDPDDVDAAYDEIDARFAAGEGAPHAEFLTAFSDYRRASAARDWETVARLLPEDFTLASHRRLVGSEAPIGRAEYLATRGRLDDLGLQGALRLDHLPHLSGTAAMAVMAWAGTVGGGEFEDGFVAVCRHDGATHAQRRVVRLRRLRHRRGALRRTARAAGRACRRERGAAFGGG